MSAKLKGAEPQRPLHVPTTCSICAATSVDGGITGHLPGVATSTPSSYHGCRRGPAPASPRIVGGLDASFVNIHHSQHLQSEGRINSFEKKLYDVESILDDALGSTHPNKDNASRTKIVNGTDMQEASQKMGAFLEHATKILSGTEAVEEGVSVETRDQNFYCPSCLDRISVAIEMYSQRLDEECMAYDSAAISEEERASLLLKVLSLNPETSGLGVDDIHGDEYDGTAIHRTMESFQYELENLTIACNEQEKELRTLKKYYGEQMNRSTAISEQEDFFFHKLNELEIDTRHFSEQAHGVSNSCSVVENEIEAMSHVRLMLIPYNITIHWGRDDVERKSAGRYPTINNLRLAYRINEKAGLYRDEINAAFCNAAQLMAFTLGIYPSFITSTIQIIPIRPCAKILVNIPEGQSVHSLGFDNINGTTDHPNHVPFKSLALFLVLLSELSSHVLYEISHKTSMGVVEVARPPFDMKDFTIDNVDVTKLGASDTSAWSSVVFCIAANLHWLTELDIVQASI